MQTVFKVRATTHNAKAALYKISVLLVDWDLGINFLYQVYLSFHNVML